MSHANRPEASELPPVRHLAVATALAGVVASVLMVTAVLPAELGIDPTGAGSVLGLTAMGELKHEGAPTAVTPPASPVVEGAASPPAPEGNVVRTDEIQVTLGPNESAEVKAVMRAGDQMMYSWVADAAVVFDFHGEPKGAAADVFTSYSKGSESGVQADFEAPFEGVHGWYWKNRTSKPVTIRVRTTGVYQKISRTM